MPYEAQIIQLNNGGHPDQEVILYCDNFYDLIPLLSDPKTILGDWGSKYDHQAWNMRPPITAVLRSSESTSFLFELDAPDISFDLLPHDKSLNMGLNLHGPKGGFIAQFAKGTHTLLITYYLPTNFDPFDARVAFTKATAIVAVDDPTNSYKGTVHFDLDAPGTKVLNEIRAAFVVHHIAQPDAHTWLRLDPRPYEDSAPTPVAPRIPPADLQLKVPPMAVKDVAFQQVKNNATPTPAVVYPTVIVEGLSMEPGTGETFIVCVQSGATRVPDGSPVGYHWEINGVIVKNYVEGTETT